MFLIYWFFKDFLEGSFSSPSFSEQGYSFVQLYLSRISEYMTVFQTNPIFLNPIHASSFMQFKKGVLFLKS